MKWIKALGPNFENLAGVKTKVLSKEIEKIQSIIEPHKADEIEAWVLIGIGKTKNVTYLFQKEEQNPEKLADITNIPSI